jgi:hypothetical protein
MALDGALRLLAMDGARISLFEHDLFGKPVPTFPDHALARTES